MPRRPTIPPSPEEDPPPPKKELVDRLVDRLMDQSEEVAAAKAHREGLREVREALKELRDGLRELRTEMAEARVAEDRRDAKVAKRQEKWIDRGWGTVVKVGAWIGTLVIGWLAHYGWINLPTGGSHGP